MTKTAITLAAATLISALPLISPHPSVAAEKGDAPIVRLPDSVVPVSYRIFVEPHPGQGSFDGTETVDVQIGKPGDSIVLNAVDLDIDDVTCHSLNASSQALKGKVECNSLTELATLKFPRTLAPGQYALSLSFHGKLSDKCKGFFRSSYLDSEQRKHWVVATQMEPTDARRMFPCFDEPQFKAVFEISTSIDADSVAISNSPQIDSKIDEKSKRKIVRFEPTPKISTYLVALAAGQFVSSEVVVSQGVPIRIWSTPGNEHLTGFSKDLAAKLIPYYQTYFDIKYPAKKLDLIAVPDFTFGAMENLGAIIFSEDNLLVDAGQSSLDARQQVAINVAHEMAHMWFGDLVTMKWWDDLWLNEAFAEWMSTKAVDKLEPDWHYWNQFVLERDQSMMSDSLKATRSIHCEVNRADQIEQMFDEITYEKGASVLRMLERFVSADALRGGIRKYLKSHEYANATTEDLWAAIKSTSGKNVPELMHSWVYQDGFPLVSVGVNEQSTSAISALTRSHLNISQNRFTFQRNVKLVNSSSPWNIPIEVRSLQSGNSQPQKFVMSTENTLVNASFAPPYVLNAGGEGYFHVRYSPELLRQIGLHLDRLSPLERASALSDQFYLAVSGQVPVSQFLQFASNFKHETDPAVTALLCNEFNQLNLMIDESDRSDFTAFIRDCLADPRTASNWSGLSGASEVAKHQRAQILLTLGTIGQDEEVITAARCELKHYLTAQQNKQNLQNSVCTCTLPSSAGLNTTTSSGTEEPIELEPGAMNDPELVDSICKVVAYNGGAADYADLEMLWHKAESPERQKNALLALGMFQNLELVNKTLKMSLTNKVQKQDAPDLIAQIMGTRGGRGPAWEFVHKHIIHIAFRFSEHRIFNIVMAMNALGTDKELSEVQAFFKKHPVPSQSRGINKIIEAIQVRNAVRQRSTLELTSWFNQNSPRRQVARMSSRPSAPVQ